MKKYVSIESQVISAIFITLHLLLILLINVKVQKHYTIRLLITINMQLWKDIQ